MTSPLSASTLSNATLDRQVAMSQLKLFCSHAPPTFLVQMAMSSIVAVYLWNVIPSLPLGSWLVYQLVVNGWRLRSVKALKHLDEPCIDMVSWRRRFKLGALLAGLGWVAGEVLLFSVPGMENQMLVAVLVAGFSGGALGSLALVNPLYPIFILTMFIPFIILNLSQGTPMSYAIGVGGASYLLAVISLARRINGMVEEALRLGLQNQMLREQADAASRAKSSFLSSVSHELRTPMTSVVGFARLIRKRLDEVILPRVTIDGDKTARAVEQVRGNLEIIIQESHRLTLLINDVLDSAKLEAGKMEWNFAAVEPKQLIESAVQVTATLAEQKGLKLSWHADDGLPAVTADAPRIQQVLINLLSNAIKFTEHGQVAIEAKTTAEGMVRISVRDTGIGIAPEHLDQVFERFKQIGDTLVDKPMGTGLGLDISRQIVEGHGGRIWVEAEPGLGSTFLFTLHVDQAQGDAVV
jgi:signal transduction histidine kinase